jgi:alkylhydroperoxidase family enzyme
VSEKVVPAFRPLTGIYEPSAIQQLADGRFLVVEDEKEHPLSLVTIGADGKVKTAALKAGLLQMFSSFWKLDDLEALAADRAGCVYAVTSHSRDDDGDDKKSREKLVRFRVDDDRVVQPKVVDGLKAALISRHAVLAAAAQVREVKASGGLNIEGLEISPDQKQLLIGFRSPLREGRALIARVENPAAVFDSDEAPRIAPMLDELDLGGHGIRSLSYVPLLGAYLVIGGPATREPASFGLWRWSGQPGAPARRVTVPGLQGFEKAEGLSPAVVGGVERIVIVSDDGNRAAKRVAHYLLLDPAQIQTAA